MWGPLHTRKPAFEHAGQGAGFSLSQAPPTRVVPAGTSGAAGCTMAAPSFRFFTSTVVVGTIVQSR